MTSIDVLTWNIYYGERDGLSSQQRLKNIFNIALNKNIHLIFLQEFNGCEKDVKEVLENSQYLYSIIPECSNKFSPRASTSNRYYLVIYEKNSCKITNLNFFLEDKFIYHLNSNYLRCPIQIEVLKDNKNYNFYLLHSEAWKEYAKETIDIWKRCIDPNTQNIILLGDLNLEVGDIPLDNSYKGVSDKLDHILTKNNCKQITLDNYPKSDHHFPIALTIKSQY